MNDTITIRPRRQVTFSSELLKKFGIGVGDKLVAEVKNNTIILRSQKQLALDAFAEIQRAFQESGISEKEMQDNLKKIRRDIYAKRYATQSFSRQ